MKLRVKLGLSFSLIITIMLALSLYVMVVLSAVQNDSEQIARNYMPELKAVVELERATLSAVGEMSLYASSGAEAPWLSARASLEAAGRHLADATALAAGNPALAQMEQSLATAQRALKEYEAACATTHRILDDMAALQKAMEEASDSFGGNLNTFVSEQEYLVSEEVENSGGEEFERQLGILNAANNLMSLSNELRIQFTRAQSQDAPDLAEKSLKSFTGVITMADAMAGEVSDADLREMAGDAAKSTRVYMDNGQKYVTLWRERHAVDAQRDNHRNTLLAATQSVSKTGIDNTMVLSQGAADTSSALSLRLKIGLAVAVLIAACFSMLLTRSITRPLHLGVDFATDLANGHLDKTLDIQSRDEIGTLAGALNSMVATLRLKISEAEASTERAEASAAEAHEAVLEAEQARGQADNARREALLQAASRLEQVVMVLSSASQELLSKTSIANQGATDQADKMDSASMDVERMSDSVRDVARNAVTAAEVADGTRDKANSGARIVGQVIEMISAIQAQSAELRLDMESLVGKTDAISQILDVIRDIADQTNLLALNAAIEAARAGEAGRGFAVVAEEVRKLAEDSNVAAKNIADLAALITSEIDNIVSMSQESVTDASNAKGLSSETEKEIDSMIKYLREISGATQDLAAVAEEQAASSEEIAEAVQGMSTKINDTAQAGENIRMGASEVAAASEKIAQGAESLSNLSAELQEQLSFFKMDEDGGKVKGGRARALPTR